MFLFISLNKQGILEMSLEPMKEYFGIENRLKQFTNIFILNKDHMMYNTIYTYMYMCVWFKSYTCFL